VIERRTGCSYKPGDMTHLTFSTPALSRKLINVVSANLIQTSFRVYEFRFHKTTINFLQTPEQLVFLPLLNLGLRVILRNAHATRDSIGLATWGISVQLC